MSEEPLFPLTSAQRGIWFLDKLHPNSTFYNISLIFDMSGNVNFDALKYAVSTILERHVILKARFTEIKNMPMQAIRSSVDIELLHTDLSSRSEVQNGAVESYIHNFVNRPFDLANDLLVRTALITSKENSHILIFVIHHIITDMGSMDIICRELSALYNSYESGIPPNLMQYPPQFVTYAEQNSEQQHIEVQKETFWADKLKEGIPFLNLPYDRVRGRESTFNGGIERITVARRTYTRFSDICRENSCTLFVGLLAAYAVFLHKLTCQQNVTVGTFLSKRTRVELEGMVGLLFQDVPIVIDIDKKNSFVTLISQVRKVVLEVLNNADFNVEEMASRLGPHGNPRFRNLYNCTFQLYHRNENRLSLNNTTVHQRRIFQGTKFDLMLYASASPDSLDIWFNYNSDLFETPTILNYLKMLNTLLRIIVGTPNAPISELEMLTLEQKFELSYADQTKMVTHRGKTIQDLFELQASCTPQKVAITAPGEVQWDFGHLHDETTRISYCLRDAGLVPRAVVGILVPRTAAVALANLSILKAGAICLPIDLHNPPARIAYMLRDAGASMVVTTAEVWVELNSSMDPGLIPFLLELEPTSLSNRPMITTVDPEDVAFIVYTSGSTGAPRGVMLSHRSILSQISHRLFSLQIQPTDRLCLSLSVGFSTLPMQLLLPLLNGQELAVYDEEIIKSPKMLFIQAEKDRITHLEVTVSTLAAYLRYIENDTSKKVDLGFMKLIFTAGEKLTPDIARRFYRQYPSMKLGTTFGQSEATGIMANSVVENRDELDKVVEGFPSVNNRLYVLDEDLHMLPKGVVGDIYFAGEGLASGYVNDPIATKEKFVPDPFFPGETMLKTGDIGRRLSDGRLEVVGRRDRMIKVRGNRVELGEVEQKFREYSGILECVVTAGHGPDGGQELYCYFTSDEEIPFSRLEQYLLKHLPRYMMPARILRIPQMPLNANGKVDLSSLPSLSIQSGGFHEHAHDGRSNIAEPVIVQMWREVLNLGQREISPRASFFELGGHSLKAMELVARIHDVFEVTISLKEFFSHPTLADLTEKIRSERDDK